MDNALLTLHLVEGSVSLKFTADAAHQLLATLKELAQTLKAVAVEAGGTSRQSERRPPVEYQYVGDIFLEVFCNPNIWSSPFAAKVLLTVRTSNIRLTTEAELTQVIDDISQYLEQAQ